MAAVGTRTFLGRPLLHLRRRITLELLYQADRIRVNEQHVAILAAQETLGAGVIELGQQMIEVTGDVEQSTGLVVEA